MSRSLQIADAGIIAQLALATATPAVFQAQTPKLAAPSLAAILPVPGTSRLEQKAFIVRAEGIISNAAAASTATIQILTGTDTIIANDAVLATTGAAAIAANATVGYMLEAVLFFDSVSGNLTGYFQGFIGATLVARTAITNPLTGLSGVNEPVFNLVCSAAVASANAANYAKLTTFALEY